MDVGNFTRAKGKIPDACLTKLYIIWPAQFGGVKRTIYNFMLILPPPPDQKTEAQGSEINWFKRTGLGGALCKVLYKWK